MIKDFDKITNEDIKNIQIPYNYHSHTYLCGHASGEVKDYVKIAVENNLKSIGVSDHLANPLPNSGYINFDTLKNKYLPQFEEANKLYSSNINIFRGGEIEYISNNDDYYKRLLDNLDYLVLGQHCYMYNGQCRIAFYEINNHSQLKEYYSILQQAIKSKFFSILAHPDLPIHSNVPIDNLYIQLMDDTIKCADDYGVKVELNGQGARANGFSYPSDLLINSCVKNNPSVVISADAHNPNVLCDDFTKKLYYIAKKNNLKISEDGFIKHK